jgi:hypothetical protein
MRLEHFLPERFGKAKYPDEKNRSLGAVSSKRNLKQA